MRRAGGSIGHTQSRTRRVSHCVVLLLSSLGLVSTMLLCVVLWAPASLSLQPGSINGASPSSRVSATAPPVVLYGLTASAALLSSTTSSLSRTAAVRRVLLVSFDIEGPNLNGGIGTASLALARVIARRHRVTLLHAIGNSSSPGSRLSFTEWAALFAEQYSIELLALPSTASHRYSSASYEQVRSYELMLWLVPNSGSYDIVHIHDWRGLGYYSLLAAQQGHPALQRLVFVTVCHSQTLWSALGNGRPPDTEDALKTDFMERQSIRFSQFVVWPSRYMFDWMTQHHYTLPLHGRSEHGANLVVMRNPIVLADDDRPQGKEPQGALLVSEWVYFARLEERKGLDLFLDAASLVEDSIHRGELRLPAAVGALRFTLMGKFNPQLSPSLLRRVQAVQLLSHWRVLTNFSASDAVRYLRERSGVDAGRIAVMPSRMDNSPYTVQEALVHGIPFIASNVGGVPELIHEADRQRVTFAPTAEALAERMTQTHIAGFVPARPSFDAHQDAQDWLDWHDALPSPAPRLPADSGAEQLPLVSVVMSTYNRTQYVLEALDSLRVQTYSAALLEVIVVNDGTRDATSLAYYEAVAASVRLEPRWQYVLIPHGGESMARNAGSERAHGEYITFMDDDNVAHPEQIATFVRAARHTSADVLTCMAETFSGSSPSDVNGSAYWWMPLGPSLGLSVHRNVIGDSNLFISAAVLRRFGGFGASTVAEDWELLTRLMLGGASIQLVPHVLLWKRNTELSRQHVVESVDNRMGVVDAFLGPDMSHDAGLALLVSREAMKRVKREQTRLASSVADFADRQGYKLWSYTRWTEQRPERERLWAMRQRGSDGTVGAHEWKLSQRRNDQSACFVRSHSQQPCAVDGQSLVVARSWLATYDCTVVLTGTVSRESECRGVAVVAFIEVKRGVSIFEAELHAGDLFAVPSVEAVVRFNESVVIGTRLAPDTATSGLLEQSQQCHAVRVDVTIALKPRAVALW